METKLATHLCFGERFRFVLHIDEPGEGRVTCRAEIFERSALQATLELTERSDRVAIAQTALGRCIRWAEERIRQAP